MVTGVFVTARMGSTRLADKHLRLIQGREALSYLLERIHQAFAEELKDGSVRVVLVTGNEARNRPLGELARKWRASAFFGDDDNVPLRHLQAARSLAIDHIVSVDGDDLFCAPEAMRMVFSMLRQGDGVAKTTGLPLGMNCWGYDVGTLSKALEGATQSVLETGWGRIFAGLPERSQALECPRVEAVRATLDYDEDLQFFTRCIKDIPGWSGLDCRDFVGQILARDLHQINAGMDEVYWRNFNSGMAQEGNKRVSTP